MKTVFAFGGCNPYNETAEHLLMLEQHEDRKALFRVTYGAQVRDGLTYAKAAKEFGECMFHHFACESMLNNEGA
jgi:hypothetical protein